MPKSVFQKMRFEVDEDGHLWNVEDYGPKWVAHCLHINESLPPKQKIVACLNEDGNLTDEHYEVIEVLRDYYRKNKISPLGVILYKAYNTPPRRIYELFPAGPYNGACKLAGLPSKNFERLHW